MCACGEEELKLKYQRFGRTVVLAEGEQGGHIVVCATGDKSVVIQSYAGEPETIGAIIVKKIEEGQWERVDARLPMYPNKFCGVFKELMIDYGFGYTGKMAVLDIEKTFGVFTEHFNLRVDALSLKGKILLKMLSKDVRGISNQEILIEADGKQLNISRGTTSTVCGAEVVELTCHQVVELLFSPLCLGWSYRFPPKARWLASLMPVPYYIPPLYHI